MSKAALYSRAARRRTTAPAGPIGGDDAASFPADDFDSGPSEFTQAWTWVRQLCGRHPRTLLVTASVMLSLSLGGLYSFTRPRGHVLTQTEIDAAVKYTLSNTPRAPVDSARAAAIIRPTVVAVEGYLSPEHAQALATAAAKAEGKKHPRIPDPKEKALKDKDLKDKTGKSDPPTAGLPDKAEDEPHPDSIGSGVVVKEDGTIMTALHVVSGTDRWVVVFADGSRADAKIIGAQPENDLAIIKADHVPDEQPAAILTSTAHLRSGDEVVATGFPFGIGPSVTSGVVSGLKREFSDRKNQRKYTNLIQFDAAVNPGNSGGPLVDRDGEVVGIVTALLNPTDADVFVGIGFAVPIENAASALGENPM
jgi:S1-C subfamily serine protease